jgi:exonuclease III
MRLLTWNVGHQTRARTIPAEAARALAGLSPDIVVLNEYVYSADHQDFYSALTEHGLTHSLISDHAVGQNQVAIVSRHKLDSSGAIVGSVPGRGGNSVAGLLLDR